MSITVNFEVNSQPETGPLRVSPSGFAIDIAKEPQRYAVRYGYNLNTKEIDTGSIYVKEFISDYGLTPGQEITVPIESRFRDTFPLYVEFVLGRSPDIITKKQLTESLQLADWLNDETYIDYTVQKIFDNWSSLMSVVVCLDFYAELQELVFIRAPYFLLSQARRDDKIFMREWFERRLNNKVLVDKRFLHHINAPVSGAFGPLLYNSFSDNYDSYAVTPVVAFYDDSNHRIQRVAQMRQPLSEFKYVGEFTLYANDDDSTVVRHGYYNNNSEKTGIWTEVASDGSRAEVLYEHDVNVNPNRSYYASGNFRGYYVSGVGWETGAYPFYNDDAGSTLRFESIYEDDKLVLLKHYNHDRLYSEFYYDSDNRLYAVKVYYENGRLKQQILPNVDILVFDEVNLEELLNEYNIHIINYYYDSDSYIHDSLNKESEGDMSQGVKTGTWHYFNDDTDNTLKDTVRHWKRCYLPIRYLYVSDTYIVHWLTTTTTTTITGSYFK